MTWSAKDALDYRLKAFRCLLGPNGGQYIRSLEWREQRETDVPAGVWSLLLAEGFVTGNVMGGPTWRLTVAGWIEACRHLREEIDLDERFGRFARQMKALGGRVGSDTTTRAVAGATGLEESWVFDAVAGSMAEVIYGQYGPTLLDRMGGLEIPAHLGNKIVE